MVPIHSDEAGEATLLSATLLSMEFCRDWSGQLYSLHHLQVSTKQHLQNIHHDNTVTTSLGASKGHHVFYMSCLREQVEGSYVGHFVSRSYNLLGVSGLCGRVAADVHDGFGHECE